MPPVSNSLSPRSQTVEELLLENAIEMGSRQEEQSVSNWKSAGQWCRQHSVILTGAVLILVGGMGVWKFSSELGRRFSEALLVAGVLSLSVDLYLKRQLQEDAARDIFQHLLGINLPSELRTKLQEFVSENKIYRKHLSILADAKEIEGGVELTITINATVVAAKGAVDYQQLLMAEESEEARILYASLRSSTEPLYANQADEIQMQPNDEPMVVRWKGGEQQLSKGDELTSYIQYAVKGKDKDFKVIFFGTSVIPPIAVRVTASDGLEIFASKADQQNGNEYVYKKVFLTGDHIQIRWKPKLSTSKTSE